MNTAKIVSLMMVPFFITQSSLTTAQDLCIIGVTSVSQGLAMSIPAAKMRQTRGFCIMETGYAVEKITDGLLELMGEKPFEKITVSDIVRRAEVGRASFYRHFDSKEAVVHHHLSRLLKEWGREFEAIGKPEELGPSLLRHFYGHRNFYLLLHHCGMSHYLLEAIRGAMELDSKSEQEAYPLSWFAGGLYGLVDEWMRRGMVTSPDELEAMSRENSE